MSARTPGKKTEKPVSYDKPVKKKSKKSKK